MALEPDKVYLRDTRTGRVFQYEAVLAKKPGFEQFVIPAKGTKKVDVRKAAPVKIDPVEMGPQ